LNSRSSERVRPLWDDLPPMFCAASASITSHCTSVSMSSRPSACQQRASRTRKPRVWAATHHITSVNMAAPPANPRHFGCHAPLHVRENARHVLTPVSRSRMHRHTRTSESSSNEACRRNMTHIKELRPVCGLGFQVKASTPIEGVPYWPVLTVSHPCRGTSLIRKCLLLGPHSVPSGRNCTALGIDLL